MASSVSVLTRFDYGGPQLSRQNQKAHGKNKILHGKTENLTAKTKYLTRQNRKPQKTKTSRQNQKPHGKNKKTSLQNQRPHGKTKYFTAKTKYLTAKPNTSQQKPHTSRQKQIPTAKPKLLCFCCEVFGFAVTVLGHRIWLYCTKLKTLFFHNFIQPKVHWLRRNVGYSRVQALPWTCQLWRRQASIAGFLFSLPFHFSIFD